MGTIISAIASLFSTSPGAVTHHLVAGLALALLGGLALLRQKHQANAQRACHILVGAGILLLVQAVQMIATALFLEDLALNAASMGLIEHLSLGLTLIWIVWTLIEEDRTLIVNGLAILLSLGVLFLGAISTLLTVLEPQLQFQASVRLNLLWQLGNAMLLLAGMVLLILRKPQKWVVGLLVLGGLGLGLGLQLAIIDGGLGLMGLVRLAQAVSLPWLLTLVSRFPTGSITNQSDDRVASEQKVDTKPELVDLLLQINLQEDHLTKVQAAIRALSLSVVADICYLAEISPDGETVTLVAGYDLIREISLPGATLQTQQLLHIMDAWADQRTLQFTETRADIRDADTFTLLLKYHRIGSLLAFPLNFPGGRTLGGVILLSPYTSKRWGNDTLHLLDEIKATLTEVLFGSNQLETLQTELEERSATIEQLRQNADLLSQTLAEKEQALYDLQTAIKQLKAKYQIEKLESVKQMEALRQELQTTQQQTGSQTRLSARLEQLRTEIRQLTQERDRLQTALARANARIRHLENQAGQTGPTRLSIDNQIISLDSIAANVRLQVAQGLQQSGIDLEIVNPDGRQVIKTDPELVQTALQHLLTNAIAAAPAGSTIQLALQLTLETGMLVVEVTDHGKGLTADEQSSLFNAGQVLVPGIGDLPAIRNAIRAVRLLNGKIWLRSQKNRYTTFRIQLPVRIID
ncbi:MAG: ATP-binding protein [Chloroflexota bacterium]|nr:ATP-binding protein [Chloroflexota bacterium]